MVALYRGGRQTEALQAYSEIRERLDVEIGVEPGSELRRLHRHILSGAAPEPDLGPPPGAASRSTVILPGQLPPDLACFVGRQQQLAGARAKLGQDGHRGGIAIVAVFGMAGVGKTTFALHLAHDLLGHFPDGQLYVDLHAVGSTPLDPAEALLRFLRSVGISGQDVPADPAERAAMYRSVLAGRRMLVVLDNAASESQVEPLLPGGHSCAVLVTSRRKLSGLRARTRSNWARSRTKRRPSY